MDKTGNVIIHLFLLPGILGRPPLPTNKLSLATWESYYEVDHMGPGTYAFGYDIEDPVAGNVQFRQEERLLNGTVIGSYGYVDAYGDPVVVHYVADEKGYRATIGGEKNSKQHFPPSDPLTRKLFRIPPYYTNNLNRNNNEYSNYLATDADVVEFNYSK